MSEQSLRERECIHRTQGAEGEYYKGSVYVKHLQRLRTAAAMEVASKVTSFFWADAAQVVVWLCQDCAAELDLCEREASAGTHAFSRGSSSRF